jgi:hypothetical protein
MPPATVADLSHHSTDSILADPRFPEARRIYVDAIVRLYENEPMLNRLMHEAGRMAIFFVVMCLNARYDPDDRASWPTVGRVKKALGRFQAASQRRIDDIVGRLVSTGYLRLDTVGGDRRVRIVKPTDAMLAHDQDWMEAHYAPLAHMFPRSDYALPLRRDPRFQTAQRLASLDILDWSARIMADNFGMALFLGRAAGALILTKLVQLMDADPGGLVPDLAYADIGPRFGVSRTHVRTLLQDAEQAGFVRLSGEGGRFVQLTPGLVTAFDRFVADGMSSHDLTWRMAMRRLAGAGDLPAAPGAMAGDARGA